MMLFLMAASSSAGPINSRPFSLAVPIIVNGAEIPAGLYTLQCESRESTAFVTFSKDGTFIAGGKGTWVKQGVKYTEDEVLLRVNANGSRTLQEIRLAGFNRTIVFANPILDLSANRAAHTN